MEHKPICAASIIRSRSKGASFCGRTGGQRDFSKESFSPLRLCLALLRKVFPPLLPEQKTKKEMRPRINGIASLWFSFL